MRIARISPCVRFPVISFVLLWSGIVIYLRRVHCAGIALHLSRARTLSLDCCLCVILLLLWPLLLQLVLAIALAS